MVGSGSLLLLFSAIGLLYLWRGRFGEARWFIRIAPLAIVLPFIGNATGWIFTEMGRQPWVVQGVLLTSNGVSPSVPAWEIAISFAGFTLLYGVLAAVDGWLMFRYARSRPAPAPVPTPDDVSTDTHHLAMGY